MHITSAPALEAYWAEFELSIEDLDLIFNLLLEREVPLTSGEMTAALVEHRLEQIQRAQSAEPEPELPIYVPSGSYEVGDRLAFPQLNNRLGSVIGVREGSNPDLAPFSVIQIEFEGSAEPREFAANFEDHALNLSPAIEVDTDAARPVDEILQTFGGAIQEKVEARLEESPDTVRIAGRWFHAGLLADINEGHLNLAEAVLDVAEGGPLPTDALVQPMEIPPGLDPLLKEFSVDYALQEDERFDEVGPAGKVLWYLKRLEPPQVLEVPERLAYEPPAHNTVQLTEELLDLEWQLDDELSDAQSPARADGGGVTLPLLFSHWSVGSLPLSSRLEPLFPTAYEAPRIRFILIDGHTGEKFPGWVVRRPRYVYGLASWYRKYELPVGGLVRVQPAEQEGEVMVEVLEARQRNDWIRTVTVDDSARIGFTMLKHPVGTAHDERMIVGILDAEALQEAWETGEQRKMPLDQLVVQVFRELAKLNPQATVHATELYSAINVIRRLPPRPVFSELVAQPYYVHVGDQQWRLDKNEWKKD